jgi:hypothetical protein
MFNIKTKFNLLDKKIAEIFRESTRKNLETYTKMSQNNISDLDLVLDNNEIDKVNSGKPIIFLGITFFSFLAGYYLNKKSRY